MCLCSVDMPAAYDIPGEQVEGCAKPQLMLLRDISGAFRPGQLTTLMGATGAGELAHLLTRDVWLQCCMTVALLSDAAVALVLYKVPAKPCAKL